jgi:hypothetical protein
VMGCVRVLRTWRAVCAPFPGLLCVLACVSLCTRWVLVLLSYSQLSVLNVALTMSAVRGSLRGCPVQSHTI